MFGALRDRQAIQRAQGVMMQRDSLNASDAYARLSDDDLGLVRVDLARPQDDGDPNVAAANEHDIQSAEVKHTGNT